MSGREDLSDRSPRWWQRALGATGSVLIVLGTLLVAATGGLYAYAQYERYQFEIGLEATMIAESYATTPPTPVVLPAESPSPSTSAPSQASPTLDVDPSTSSPSAKATSTATVTAVPTPTPVSPPTRIIIPAIKLDSRIVQSPIVDGEWKVPKFVAGHLEGTALPGQNGNVALSGHVESLSSGNVFSEIGKLAPGDEIYLQAGQTWLTYTVEETTVVPSDDVTVLMYRGYPSLTLITCTGDWNPLTRDYRQRLIVIARPASDGGVEEALGPDRPE